MHRFNRLATGKKRRSSWEEPEDVAGVADFVT